MLYFHYQCVLYFIFLYRISWQITNSLQILTIPIEGYWEVNKQNNHYRYYLKPFAVSANKRRTRTYIKDINIAKSIANHDYASQWLSDIPITQNPYPVITPILTENRMIDNADSNQQNACETFANVLFRSAIYTRLIAIHKDSGISTYGP